MSKNQNYEEYQDQDDNRPLSIEEQRARLRQLIIMGKERGYITYSEINDALPDDMSDAEQIRQHRQHDFRLGHPSNRASPRC